MTTVSDFTWPDTLTRLIKREDLSYDQAGWAIKQTMSGEATQAQFASFLTALASKGTNAEEIRGMADAMVSMAVPINVEGEVLDIVGTGGDHLHTANISTTASLVIASAGIPVVKHGNRASTSKSGAADVLESMGMNLNLCVEAVEKNFANLGITFIFANVFHPAMRYVAPVRRELGVATAFNILGPLTNPARPATSVIGVGIAGMAELMANVLAERGSRALVFRGRDHGMDELSTVGVNDVWEVRDYKVTHHEFDAVKELGLPPASVEDLRGGDAVANAEIMRAVLGGEKGAIRDAVMLNAAAAFVAEGSRVAPSDASFSERMAKGCEIARERIDSGAALSLLDRWIEISRSES